MATAHFDLAIAQTPQVRPVPFRRQRRRNLHLRDEGDAESLFGGIQQQPHFSNVFHAVKPVEVFRVE